MSERKTLVIALIIAAAIVTVGSSYQKPDRPFLNFLAAAAKIALRVMVFAEPPPQDMDAKVTASDPDTINHARSL